MEGESESAGRRSLYGQPFSWLLFGWLLVLVPVVGFLVESGLSWERLHPALNALLNASSAVFLIAGRFAIARRKIPMHRQCMLAAVTASALFLVSYLVRYAMTGTHHYPGEGLDKVFYLAVLFSHMVLAALLVPLVARTLFLGLKRRDRRHRRIARWAWPVWIYVSVTGVIVYLMLYPLAP